MTDELRIAIAGILSKGLLRIRARACEGRMDLCSREVDHLHNLPAILAHYRPELIRYYWEIERRCYLDAIGDAPSYAAEWQVIERHVKQLGHP